MDLIDREHLMNYIRSRKINIGKLAHDVIMKQPSIQQQEPCDNVLTLTKRVETQVTEDIDNFIFTIVEPWCEMKMQRKISKRDLAQALTQYFNKEPKTGHWVDKKCSVCGCKSMLGLCIENYCANCGAKMKSEDEDDDAPCGGCKYLYLCVGYDRCPLLSPQQQEDIIQIMDEKVKEHQK